MKDMREINIESRGTAVRKPKVKKSLGLGCVIAASFFLFNPDLAVIDLIPDFIGYMLINYGLTVLADLNDHFEEAKKRFKLMIFVSLAKLLSIFMLFGLNDAYMRPYSMLLYPCVFGVIELVLLLPAFKHFFDGLTYLSSRNDGSAAFLYHFPSKFRRRDKRRVPLKNITERTYSLTVFFLFAKSFLSVLPEFSVLTSTTYDESKHTIDLYDYIGLLRMMAILLMSIIGIVWLVGFVRYIALIIRDSKFMERLLDAYRTKVLVRDGLFVRRRLHFALFWLKITAVFAIDFYVNYYNVIPDVLFAVTGIVAIFLLRKYVTKSRYVSAVAALSVYGCVSAVASYVNAYYNVVYETFETMFRDPEAYDTYTLMRVSTAVENLLFVVAFVFVARALSDIIKGHCGYITHNTDSGFFDEQQGVLRKELQGSLKRTGIFAVLSAITSVTYDCFKQYQTINTFLPSSFIEAHPLLAPMMQRVIPGSIWFIDLIFAIAFAASFISAISDIIYFIDQRYILD